MDKYEENMAQFLQCTSVPLIQPQDHNLHRAFLSDEDKSPNSEVESTTKSLSKANSTVSSVVFHGLVCFEAIEAQKSHSNSLNWNSQLDNKMKMPSASRVGMRTWNLVACITSSTSNGIKWCILVALCIFYQNLWLVGLEIFYPLYKEHVKSSFASERWLLHEMWRVKTNIVFFITWEVCILLSDLFLPMYTEL